MRNELRYYEPCIFLKNPIDIALRWSAGVFYEFDQCVRLREKEIDL